MTKRRDVQIVDRWVVLCGLVGLATSLLATDWDLAVVTLVTAGSAVTGVAIGVVLAVRLAMHHDAARVQRRVNRALRLARRGLAHRGTGPAA